MSTPDWLVLKTEGGRVEQVATNSGRQRDGAHAPAHSICVFVYRNLTNACFPLLLHIHVYI